MAKKYRVEIELDIFEFVVTAKNKAAAKKKALAKLKRKSALSLVRKAWPSNRREITVECED